MHIKCQGNGGKPKKRKSAKVESELCITDGFRSSQTTTTTNDNGYRRRPSDPKLIRSNVWITIMGKAASGPCPICGGGPINFGNAGFECAHIDASRKKANLSIDEVWNLVPTCGQCNSNCRTQNMFDFMSTNLLYRQKIPRIAARKLYVHFAIGFDCVQRTDSPSVKDLQRCIENGELNFQKLVREAYGCEYINPDSDFNYEKLLDISDEVREYFFSILNTKSPREYDVETFPC